MTAPDPATSSIHLRRMQEADLEQVQAIDRMSFALPWPASAFRYELFENTGSLLWVAEVEQSESGATVVGVIVIWVILDEAHIATIAVHPEYRSRGVGRRLLATALQDAIHKGCRSATLEVREGNAVARSFYRRFRFDEVGRRPRYYRDNNEDALIMTVPALNPAYLAWLESGAGEALR
ncbi:MAG: ribosomal protein S18-alanine N-acetyltransferase [Anaerolineales bacterium]|nr:ribosomal protein S18-alanine N-acetyltransferase [Anaerolineales bacterium]